MKGPTELHDTAAAAALLGVTEDWLRRRVARNEVPHRRLGRLVRFSDADLAEIVAAAHRPAVAPAQPRRRRTA